MVENKMILKVLEQLNEMSEDEEERKKAFTREVELSYKKFKRECIEEGRLIEKVFVIRKMKKENLDTDLIIRVTGVTKEELEELEKYEKSKK